MSVRMCATIFLAGASCTLIARVARGDSEAVRLRGSIVFSAAASAGAGSEIYTMDANGSRLRQLSADPARLVP